MLLDGKAQRELLAALDALKGGSPRRFEDRLWLGFGDDWTTLRSMLVRDGCVREIPGDAPAYTLLVKGEALRLRIEEALRSKSEGSATGVRVALAASQG